MQHLLHIIVNLNQPELSKIKIQPYFSRKINTTFMTAIKTSVIPTKETCAKDGKKRSGKEEYKQLWKM